PDGKNLLTIEATDGAAEGPLRYSVARHDRVVIRPSRLGMRLADVGPITRQLRLTRMERGDIDESFELPWGKCRTVRDHCRWTRAHFASSTMNWLLELRAYDDGIAFRYLFPMQPGPEAAEIVAEETEIDWADSATMHFMACKNFHTDHENEYRRESL